MQPATIKLFLTDGEPTGIRTAEISNWTGKAIAGPRSKLAEIKLREELKSPGIYLLTGVDPSTDESTLYIGEAESVIKRLSQHHQGSKEWNQLVAFISKDENLTKAHIRYLENALIQKAKNANRSLLLNSVVSGSSLPESDQADMNVYLDKILQLLPILGVEAFKTVTARRSKNHDENDDLLYCEIKGLKATGQLSDNGFIIFKGSQAVKEHRPSSIRTRAKREALVEKKVLVDKEGCLEFSQDYEFSSPSAAAAIVRGGASNGLNDWKNQQGIKLKDLG